MNINIDHYCSGIRPTELKSDFIIFYSVFLTAVFDTDTDAAVALRLNYSACALTTWKVVI